MKRQNKKVKKEGSGSENTSMFTVYKFMSMSNSKNNSK